MAAAGLNIHDYLPVIGGDLDGDGYEDGTSNDFRITEGNAPGIHTYLSGEQSNEFFGTDVANVFFDAAGPNGVSGNDVFHGEDGTDTYVYLTPSGTSALSWVAINDLTYGAGFRVYTPDGDHDDLFSIENKFNRTFTSTHSLNFSTLNAGIEVTDKSLTDLASLNNGFNWINGGTDFLETAVSVGDDVFGNIGTFTGTSSSDAFNLNKVIGRTFSGGLGRDTVDYSAVASDTLVFSCDINGNLLAENTLTSAVDTLTSIEVIHTSSGNNTVVATPSMESYNFFGNGYDTVDASSYTEAIFVEAFWNFTYNYAQLKFASEPTLDRDFLGSYSNFDKIIGTQYNDWFVVAEGVAIDGGGGEDMYRYVDSNGNFWNEGSYGVGGIGQIKTSEGEITSMANANNSGTAAAQWAGYAYAIEEMHPYVITAAFAGGGTATMSFETYLKNLNLIDGITVDDIRFVANDSYSNDAALTIYIETSTINYSFTVTDFESGRIIVGLGMYDMDVQNQISQAGSATLTGITPGSYSGSYGAEITYNSSSPIVHYYFERITFQSGGVGSIDMTGNLTFKGSSSYDYMYGLNTRDDAIYAYGGDDVIYAKGGHDTLYGGDGADFLFGEDGNDILDGGAGDDVLYGGDGDDLYVFSSAFGADVVSSADSGGTNTAMFVGYDLNDFRIWSDSQGYLHFDLKSDVSNNMYIQGAVTGYESFETTAYNVVQNIIFDDIILDLTSDGLAMEGTSSQDDLYGTEFDDILQGYDGGDWLYGNRGNDILHGGAGSDYLFGGSGADTFVFNAATAYSGSDTIGDFNGTDGDIIDIRDLLTGYDPLVDVLSDFVSVDDQFYYSDILVDRDGAGSLYGFDVVATINGLTGYDETTMVANGYLLAA